MAHVLHAYLLPLLIAAYALAAFLPSLGTVARTHVFLERPLPVVLLGALLFFAGVGIEPRELGKATRCWWQVLLSCVLLVGVPGGVVALLSLASRFLPEGTIAGLGLVALMPTAAASVAWTQLSRGNVTINFALLLLSTLLTPLILTFAFNPSSVEFSDVNMPIRMFGSWIVPAVLLGILVRYLLGEHRVAYLRPALKVCNVLLLLFLNYTNASLALPEIVRDFQPQQLLMVIATTALMCSIVFGIGVTLTSRLGVGRSEVPSLVYGIGMKNTGMALVLAAVWLDQFPLAMVAIIVYTFCQHVLAGIFHQWNQNTATQLIANEVHPTTKNRVESR